MKWYPTGMGSRGRLGYVIAASACLLGVWSIWPYLVNPMAFRARPEFGLSNAYPLFVYTAWFLGLLLGLVVGLALRGRHKAAAREVLLSCLVSFLGLLGIAVGTEIHAENVAARDADEKAARTARQNAARRAEDEATLHKLDEAIRIDPRDTAALLERGRIKLRDGALSASLADLGAVVALEPDNAAARLEFACALHSAKRDAECALQAKEAILLEKRHDSGVAYSGRCGTPESMLAQCGQPAKP